MGTKRWNVSEDKETLHGNPHGYGQGIKGKDEKQKKKRLIKIGRKRRREIRRNMNLPLTKK